MLNNIVALLGNGAGGGGSYESIATATPSGASTFTFSSIPSTYKHLQIRYWGKTTNAAVYALNVTINSDSGNNYANHILQGDGASVSASGGGTTNPMDIFGSGLPGNSWPNIGSVAIVDVHDYASTSKFKTVRALGGYDRNGSGQVNLTSSLWQSTSAISSITFTLAASTFATDTTFALYGIKGA